MNKHIHSTSAVRGLKNLALKMIGTLRAPVFVLICALIASSGMAQNMSINSTGARPDSSAMLDVQSTTQGFLMPRMTISDRAAISNPANGLMIYQVDSITGVYVYDTASAGWRYLNAGAIDTIPANTFSAGINGNLGAGVTVSSESYPFIQSVSHGGTGFFDIVFIPGFFTEAPSAVATARNASTHVASVANVSTDSMRVVIRVSNTAITADEGFYINLQRQGADYQNTLTAPPNVIGIRDTNGIDSVLFYGNDAAGDSILNLGGVGIGTTALSNSALRIESTDENAVNITQNYTGSNPQRGLLVTMSNAGTGTMSGVSAIVTPPAGNASNVSGVATLVNANGTGPVNGVASTVQGTGTGIRYGVSSAMTNPSGNANAVYGIRSDLENDATSSTFGVYSVLDGAGDGLQSAYHSVLNTTGDGTNYGVYVSLNGSGTGDNYGIRIDQSASGSGTEYGVYTQDEDLNYFSGSVGIGTATPSAKLHVMDSLRIQDSGNSRIVTIMGNGEIESSSGQNLSLNRFSSNNVIIAQGGGDVGVGTNVPGVKLNVDGDFQADTISVDGAFTLPSVDGTNGQVLETDGAGNVTWQTVSGVTPDEIADADNDTRIRVEQSADDDRIRFYMEGTEFFRMDSGKIEVLNSGGNIFIGEDAGRDDLLTNDLNVGIGRRALRLNNGGDFNTALGTDALETLNGGSENVALGARSLNSSTTGSANTAIGRSAGRNNIVGDSNVFLGYLSGRDETGSQKLYISNSATSTPLIYGDFAADSLVFNGQVNIGGNFVLPNGDGTNGQVLQTDGAGNVSWAAQSATLSGGLTDRIARWATDSTLDTSMIIDDGTTVAINATPGTSGQLLTETDDSGISAAVRGNHNATGSNVNFGVYGFTASSDGNNAAGVYGRATNGAFAVYGQQQSSATGSIAVNGWNPSGGANENYGVKGQTSSSNAGSAGLFGFAFHGGNAVLAQSNARVIEAEAYGTRTAGYNAVEINNNATTTTAGIDRTALNIQSTSAWTGAGNENIGLNVDVGGGTTNYAALFNGGNVGVGTSTPAAALQVDSFIVMDKFGVNHFMGFNMYNDAGTLRHLHDGAVDVFSKGQDASTGADVSGIYHFAPQVAGTALTPVPLTGVQFRDSTISFTSAASDTAFDLRGHTLVDSLTISGAYSFPATDGSLNQVLVTDGGGNVTWQDPAGDTDWTQGSGVLYNNSSDDIIVGSTFAVYPAKFTVNTPNSTAFQHGLAIDHNYSGGIQGSGIIIDFDSAGLGTKYGVNTNIRGSVSQTNTLYGAANLIRPGNTEQAYGVLNNIFNSGSGNRYGTLNTVSGGTAQTGSMYGTYNNMTPGAGGITYGNYNYMGGGGGSIQYGVFNQMQMAAGTPATYGIRTNMVDNASSAAYGYFAFFSGSGTSTRRAFVADLGSGGGTDHGLYIQNETYNYLTGDLGIGIASPTADIHVQRAGAVETHLEATDGSTVGLTLENSTTDWAINNFAGELRIIDNGTNRLTIESTGEVGIGTFNPTGALEVVTDGSLLNGLRVSATTAATVGASIYMNGASRDWTITATNSSASSGANKLVFRDYSGATDIMTLETSGEVGIGTNNPSAELDVVGDIEIPAANDYTYATARTNYFSIGAAAFEFMNNGTSTSQLRLSFSSNAVYIARTDGGTSGNQAYLVAPVSLPHGATITGFRVGFFDNDATYNCSATLVRQNITSATNVVVATVGTSGTGGLTTQTTSTVNNNVVDNSLYSYQIVFDTREDIANLGIYGVRIEYTVDHAD